MLVPKEKWQLNELTHHEKNLSCVSARKPNRRQKINEKKNNNNNK